MRRYGFARVLPAFLAALCLGPRSGSARDTSGAEKLGWELGLQCYTFRAISFFETVDKARELGIRKLEIYPGQRLKPGSETKTGTDMSDEDVVSMKAKLREAGIQLVSFGVAGIPTEEAAAEKHFQWAKKLGLEILVTETRPNAMLDRLSEKYGVRIALHNHPQSWPPDQVLEACKGLSKRIGSCADTGHWKRRGLVPLEALQKLKGRIIELHFKDVAPTGSTPARFEDRPWGTGDCGAKALLGELAKQGFRGPVIIEYEVGSVEDLMKNLSICVSFFDQTAAELAK